MSKYIIVILMAFQSTACLTNESAINVENRVFCSDSGQLISELTFTNTSNRKIFINEGFVAWNGQLHASSYEIWNGSKFADFKGIHYEIVEENDTIELSAKSKLVNLINLDNYYEVLRDVEYEISFNEPAAFLILNGEKKQTSLESNVVKFTVDCSQGKITNIN